MSEEFNETVIYINGMPRNKRSSSDGDRDAERFETELSKHGKQMASAISDYLVLLAEELGDSYNDSIKITRAQKDAVIQSAAAQLDYFAQKFRVKNMEDARNAFRVALLKSICNNDRDAERHVPKKMCSCAKRFLRGRR
jgi:inhibitor of KinA sporulation pathway (predicted exonuclease)